MAVVRRNRIPVKTGLKMNALFLATGVVMLGVMASSMWVDLHPEWVKYPDKFQQVELSVLKSRRDYLANKLAKADWEGDYKAAQAEYQTAKKAYDDATGVLEQTGADLEEVELRVKAASGANEEEGGATPAPSGEKAVAAPADGGGKPQASASKGELDSLDKEFSEAKGDATPAPAQTSPEKPQAAASKGELDDLDKEFANDKGSSAPAEQAKPAKGPEKAPPAPASKSDSKELSDLDKEFAASGGEDKKAATKPETKSPEKPAPAAPSTYEEAAFTVDMDAAQARLDLAKRDLVTEERVHTREQIGLPKNAEDDRKLSDLHLKEAQQSLDVAKVGIDLEEKKGEVKDAAQAAQWASVAQSNPEAKAKLDAYVTKLTRELKAIEARLAKPSASSREIHQVFVERLGSSERCTTCHLAVEDPAFTKAEEPFKTHPAKMLAWHPVEKFGCVSCHQGFGRALTKSEAHGAEVGKGMPLLVGDRVQASCGKCHGSSQNLAGESTYLEGAKLFKDSGCLGCHKVAGLDADGLKSGPALDNLPNKLRPEWLAGWIKEPRSHSLEARMPNLGLTVDQSTSIATFLMGESTKASDMTPAPSTPNQLAMGKRLVNSLGCLGCHTVQGHGASVGPELTNLKSKVQPKWLYAWMLNPKQFLPHSRMPVFGLSNEQATAIGNYLLSIGEEKTNAVPLKLGDAKARAEGEKLVSEKGCAGCHDIKGFARMAAPELSHEGDITADLLEFGNARDIKKAPYDYLVAKIMDPKKFDSPTFSSRMPKFGLDQGEANSMAIYLMSLTGRELPTEYRKGVELEHSPLVAGAKLFQQHDCNACHAVNGRGGKIGPDLTHEGEQVQPSWLFKFLKEPNRIRWWADARMPNFHLSDEEATTLVEYMMAASNQPAPYEYVPADKMVYPLASVGQKFFLDLKCQSCHPVGGKQLVSGGDTKKLGPDLGMAPKRLKGDWIFRFLKDPQALSPGTQMPSFGKPDDMYKAIVDYLMKG